MKHVLGIDAGGTKTVCLLADEKGGLVAESRGPGANITTEGELVVEKVLYTVIEEAVVELERHLVELAPGCAVRTLDGEPAAGAVRLALAALSGTLELPRYV